DRDDQYIIVGIGFVKRACSIGLQNQIIISAVHDRQDHVVCAPVGLPRRHRRKIVIIDDEGVCPLDVGIGRKVNLVFPGVVSDRRAYALVCDRVSQGDGRVGCGSEDVGGQQGQRCEVRFLDIEGYSCDRQIIVGFVFVKGVALVGLEKDIVGAIF